MRSKKQKKYTKLSSLLEMPREVVSTDAKITILGFDEIFIENYKNILEYQDIFIRVNTFQGIVNVNGYNLKLEQMTNEDIKITGRVDSIELESIID